MAGGVLKLHPRIGVAQGKMSPEKIPRKNQQSCYGLCKRYGKQI